MFAKLLIVVLGMGLVAARPAEPASSESSTPAPECQNDINDIYFLLDSSTSLRQQDFNKVLNFVISFVRKLDIAPNLTRVGLGTFSDNFNAQFSLGRYSTKDEVISAIERVPQTQGGTYTGRGLLGMHETGFRDARENAAKIGVVITDGPARFRTRAMAEAASLKDMGVWLFAIGVGRSVEREELSIFASEPHAEFVRHVAEFNDLNRLTNELAFATCRLQPPHADNATCGLRQKADVIFVYNAAAMTKASVSDVQNFTEGVIRGLSMTSGNVRVGVISEGRQGGDIPLSRYIRKEDLVEALKKQPKSQLASVLRKTRMQGFEPNFGGRPNSKKIAIIFVDDIIVSVSALLETHMMTYNDVIVYVIEVGLPADKGLVQHMPTSPDKVSEFSSYEELKNGDKQTEFLNKLCTSL